jgi:UDP-glucose 4-epimerase
MPDTTVATERLGVAVTGGSGFIGSHVVDRLVAAGHEVTVVDLRPPQRTDVAFVSSDIADVDVLERAFAGVDIVFHLAGVSNVNEAFAQPLMTVQANMAGTANVWEAARRAGVSRAVLASTVWVYAGARGEGPFDEDEPFHLPDAGHIYTSSKIAAELIVHNYAELYDMPFTILRYGIPYGPRMRDQLVIPQFVQRALDGQPLVINGGGEQFRNYVYVADLADAHLRVLDAGATNEVFNLEGRERISVRALAETVRELIGEHVRIEYRDARPGDYAGKEVSPDKALQVLGWQAVTTFREGLSRYVEWHRATHA